MDEHRRRLLTLLGAAGVSNLAGCSIFISEDDTPTDPPADRRDDPGTATETVTPIATLTPTPSAPPTETPADGTDDPGTEITSPTPRKLIPEDGDDGDHFGWSVGVSSDGTTAVIGALLDEDPNGFDAGSAYVFKRESGEWSEETKLTPEDGDSEDRFGSVGVSGDGTTVVIGARTNEDPNGEEAGSAYVFKREGGEWSEETKLTPEDGDSEDRFGYSVGVSSDGTTVVIGARRDEDPNGTQAGSAYVFKRESGEWSEERKLTPEDGDNEDEFGSSVGVSGDGTTAVIGANRDEDPNGTRAGSAYVFKRESGEWSEERKLTASDGDARDKFGSVGVSSDGTTAVIGAFLDEDPNGFDAGSAYVFKREGGEWSEETKLTPEDGDSEDEFGSSVGVSSDGTTAVIGANRDEDPNGIQAGSAYVFKREGGEWSEERKLTPEDGDSTDLFGFSVGLSSDGTTAVIGADFDEDPNGLDAGSAYVFQLGE